MTSTSFELSPAGRNVAQGAIEVGSVAILAAVVLGVAGAAIGPPALALLALLPLLAGVAVVMRRYAPMFVKVDAEADEVRYRNAWSAGVLRWSEVEGFEPSQVFVGYDVARAVLSNGSKVKLRAASYEPFVERLQELSRRRGLS
jgi:hypothetical protein